LAVLTHTHTLVLDQDLLAATDGFLAWVPEG
jgi:hypothetical protein